MRRFSVTLKRNSETGTFGLQLTDDNVVVAPPAGNELEKYDIIIGAGGERLGPDKLEQKLPIYGESSVELEVLRTLEEDKQRSFVELRRLVTASSSASSASSRAGVKGEVEESPRTAPTRRKWFSRVPAGRKPLASLENDACGTTPEQPRKSAPRSSKQAEPQTGSAGVICGWRHERLDSHDVLGLHF